MSNSPREEFLRDLNATDEVRVRDNFLTGRYAGWKRQAAAAWLQERDRARTQDLVNTQIALARKSVAWARIRALAAIIGSGGLVVVRFLTGH